jgi:hypothetical protein
MNIFEKAVCHLTTNMSDRDLLALAEAIDGDPDPENKILDLLNEVLEKRHPELFACSLKELTDKETERSDSRNRR